MDKITVIIPTYNRAALLINALESVLAQTLPAAEIIIVDDGSSDNTASIVEKAGRSAGVPLTYMKQNNRGPAAARNLGISRAVSPLIAFLDSDDVWHRKKLETQSRALQESSGHLISHTQEKWYRRGEHLNQRKKHIPRNGYIFEQCLLLCAVGMSTVLVRKELFARFGLFDESLRCCEDYEMWLRVAQCEKFLLVAQPLTIKHGGRSDQVSERFKVGMDRFRIQALGKLLMRQKLSEEQRRAVCKVLMKKSLIYGRGCRKHGRKCEAEHYLKIAHFAGLQVPCTEAPSL